MTNVRGERLKQLLAGPGTVRTALVFDAVSARVAEMRGLDVAYLSGSAVKSAALMMPDDVTLTHLGDLVEICRRISNAADIPLIMDVDDAGGAAVGIQRTVRDLEAAGVAGIEIEDNSVPRFYGEAANRHALLSPIDAQVELFKAAVAARRHDSTIIIARTGAHSQAPEPSEDFIDRIKAYSQTGADAILLPSLDHHGSDGKRDVEAASRATHLPIITVGLSWALSQDRGWLADNRVRITSVKDNWAYRMAVKAIDDCFAFLEAGGNPAELATRAVPLETVRKVMTRRADYEAWSKRYDRQPR